MGSIFNEYISIENEVEKKYGRRSVLLMMVGSFYEMYGDGCENAYEKLGNISKLLNIQLLQIKLQDFYKIISTALLSIVIQIKLKLKM